MSYPQPTESEIRSRAYEIFSQHQYQHGHDLDHWLQAEYELTQLPIRKIANMKTSPARRNRPA